MDNLRGQKVYEARYDEDSAVAPSCCQACLCCESEGRARLRRRCKSEGLEKSPFQNLSIAQDWPNNSKQPSTNNHFPPLTNRTEARKLPQRPTTPKCHYIKFHSIRESHTPTEIIQIQPSESDMQYSLCEQNGDRPDIQSRLSPHKNAMPKIVICNREPSIGRESIRRDMRSVYGVSPSKLIENEEPRLSMLEEYKEKYGETRPNSGDIKQYNMPLKSILVNNTRRSVSPSYFRKSIKGKPPPDWTESNGVSAESKRRVRARSESEKNLCQMQESCTLGVCCPAVMKRARDSSPPPPWLSERCCLPRESQDKPSNRERSPCPSELSFNRNCKQILCRDIGVGEWSIFDGVTLASSLNKQRVPKSSNLKGVPKGKQPSAKVKSRLEAIKAKKALMETCSSGSEMSDNEMSDPEEGGSKASLEQDSDASVEPADHQECLTSDSGPSVSSVSDSASLKGLSSALSIGAVVSPEQDSLRAMLRASMFPQVPPYLRFVSHDSTPLRPPLAAQRHLRWKLTTITPVVVRRTLIASGFKLIRSECATQGESMEWVGTWGKHMKSICFKGLKDSQKMNHFPGTFQIGRKDRLWRNLHKLMMKFGSKDFGLMPKTYVLPHDLKSLKHDWDKYAAQNEKWIIKPPASARGTGIKVVSRWAQIPKKRPVVVQRYIARPYLINGSKFDMRLYVLVTSVHPLRIYLYPDGLARFASVKYSEENNSLHDRYMHLTNYSINRLSKSYTHNQDAEACQGHKWTLQVLLSYLRKERGINTSQLWNSMKDLVIKTILSGESSISCLTKANIGSRFNCYELFGIDVLLDENLKPWLLEVNISPSLHSASPLDLHVKGPLVSSLLNMAQFHLPAKVNMEGLTKEKGPFLHDKRLYTVHLSKDEKQKHTFFTDVDNRMDYLTDILTNLTPDDVRHLIQSEDEFTQKANLERIFPTPDTYKYMEYFAGPRYYNRLFDAWESKYASNRKAGIKRLQELCEQGVHLEVPPIPTKNDDEEAVQHQPEAQVPREKFAVPTDEQVPLEPALRRDEVNHDCTVEGRHIVGEFCLICKPAISLLLQQEVQPLSVQQHA